MTSAAPPSPAPPAMSVRRGAAFNLAGQAIPAVAALVAIPIIQRRLGDEQLGLLMLTWAATGYFHLFDLGLRRALTHGVAVRLEADRVEGLSSLVWTTWWSFGGLGLIGSAVLIAVAPRLLTDAGSNVIAGGPGGQLALFLVAAAFPAVAVSTGAFGALEGHRRFDLVNGVRAPVVALSYFGPALAALASNSVVPAIVVLAVIRIAGAAVAIGVAWYAIPALRSISGFRIAAARELAATGVWMSVANVASSVMAYVDWLVVAALSPLASVAYYTTPRELIGKLQVIPAAICTAAFPAFSGFWGRQPERLTGAFERSAAAIGFVLFLPTLGLAVLSAEWLDLWIGGAFATESVRIVIWLAAGTLINGVAAAPFHLLQATGRSRLTAVLQLAELPVYVALLWWMTARYGIEGAAASWTIRVTVDAVLLFAATWRHLPVRTGRRTLGLIAGAAIVVVIAAGWDDVLIRIAVLVLALPTTALLVRPVLGVDLLRVLREPLGR